MAPYTTFEPLKFYCMLPDWVSNPGPLTNESGALPIALRGPASGCLVDCFGFNGPLRQYFSLYRAVSQREEEREEKG